MAAEGVGVVLDAHCGGFGGAKRVDAEQVRQGTVVHGQGVGDLQESDQLEPVQPLSACLVGVHLGQASVDGGVGVVLVALRDGLNRRSAGGEDEVLVWRQLELLLYLPSVHVSTLAGTPDGLGSSGRTTTGERLND